MERSLNVPKRSLTANNSTNPSSSCHEQFRVICWSCETNDVGFVFVSVNVSLPAEHEERANVGSGP